MFRNTVLGGMVVLGFTGCDGLTNGAYQGEARYALTGTISSLSASPGEGETYVGVIWYNFLRSGDTYGTQVATVTESDFPAEFTLALYDEPPTEQLNDLNNPDYKATGYIGTGLIVAFDDADGDGVANVDLGSDPEGPDYIRGTSPEYVMVYARDINDVTLSAITESGWLFVNPEALQPGYNLARGVCAPETTSEKDFEFDKLEIIPNEEITIEDIDKVSSDDNLCLNIT